MNNAISTWVVVADARAARIFSFTDKNDAWTLHETLKGTGNDPVTGSMSKASEHKGALHAHGEHDPKSDHERHFAHVLALVLERAHQSKAFERLALVAPPKLLGELRENLSRSLSTASVAELHKDYTHLSMDELKLRLRAELPA